MFSFQRLVGFFFPFAVRCGVNGSDELKDSFRLFFNPEGRVQVGRDFSSHVSRAPVWAVQACLTLEGV